MTLIIKKAMQVRSLVKRDFDRAFTEVDFIMTPTAPMVAWKLGEIVDDPLTMYLSDIYTVSANVAGIRESPSPAAKRIKCRSGCRFWAGR